MLPAIGWNDAILAVSASGIASGIDEGDIAIGLVDASRRTLSRDSQRLAGHDGVILVGPHVELLNLIPKLRLVHGATQIAETRGRIQLEIEGLIVLPRNVCVLRRTAA